jgi:gamma-glutamyltranspeptidase/glutathione hydrolase
MTARPASPPLPFICRKQPATASRGMVVANHPLASGAGAEMLLAGGNTFDAAVAALLALSVVEPMMVGPLGGGIIHLREADGRHAIIDGLSTAPAAATPAMFRPLGPGLLPNDRETEGRLNALGARAVAVPGALAAWAMLHRGRGRLPFADLVEPAIRLARRGFAATPYLADCVADTRAYLARDPGLAALFLPGGEPIGAGARIVQPVLAEALGLIARQGAAALHGEEGLGQEGRGGEGLGGPLGRALVGHLAGRGGVMTAADLAGYRPLTRAPIIGDYRGFTIVGPPPPASAGIHIVQMLNILAAHDVAAMGFASPDAAHLTAEAIKIAFADRGATADPAFVDVPAARIVSADHARARLAELDMARARDWAAPAAATSAAAESADTTHLTVADAEGNVVCATQTINGLFGACLMIPETGMLANNYMLNFDPHPGRPLSIQPGKRCFTSMAPMMVTRDGRVHHALGLPGGLRIFPSALQAIVNLIDFGMTPQQAVEAPRLWTEGGRLELEGDYPEATATALAARGHAVIRNPRIGGGMNLISFGDDGLMTGAACWRADGTPVAVAGGLAAAGVRFSI